MSGGHLSRSKFELSHLNISIDRYAACAWGELLVGKLLENKTQNSGGERQGKREKTGRRHKLWDVIERRKDETEGLFDCGWCWYIGTKKMNGDGGEAHNKLRGPTQGETPEIQTFLKKQDHCCADFLFIQFEDWLATPDI